MIRESGLVVSLVLEKVKMMSTSPEKIIIQLADRLNFQESLSSDFKLKGAKFQNTFAYKPKSILFYGKLDNSQIIAVIFSD